MSEPYDFLKPIIEHAITGKSIAMAILDDYCETVAKIEGDSPIAIKKRVLEKAKNHHEQFRNDFLLNLPSEAPIPKQPGESPSANQ